jgi:WD40 repeat protein
MPRYDVFLSHASADKPAVEHIARRLRDEKLEPFLDKWHLVPGEPWQEGMEDALRESRTCAVFIGKKLGPWQNEEMRTALARRVKNRSYRVIPVLLPGGPEAGLDDLSEFLGRLTWVDFRAGLDDQDAFRRLLAGIRGEAPGPGGGEEKPPLPLYRCMAPAREPFVQRSEYKKVRDALLLDEAGRAPTVGITTAIHGAGGFGKTALAIELCYDEQLRERYPEGILWTTLGEEIDAAGRLARVRDLIRWWTEKDPPAFETVSAASAHLRQDLNGQRALLVVDDVWRPEDVTPFQGLAPLLVTTRDSRTLPSDAVQVHVDAMEVPEAVRLLGAGLPAGAEAELKPLAARLGEWPLLLKIVNRQLRDLVQEDGLAPERALREVVEALAAEGLTVFDREDLESRGQAVARTVGASLRRLAGEDVSRFEQLAIFPEDKDIPLQILEKLWGSGSFATKKLCGHLHDLSLLLRFDRQAGTIRLHDVIRAYLLKKGESHLVAWHRRLLDACRPANGRWPDLPREESYLWNHLIHHLLGAGQSDVCRALLLDFHYLRSKLSATDVNALLADYSSFAEQDAELRLVRDALRLSAHVLARSPVELPGQLWGRLLGRQEAGIRSLLQASEDAGAPWLRPRKATLTRPGGALIRTIDHPGSPEALAVLPDGRVVSGSTDGTLRVWDVESGQTLQTLGGHSDWVSALAVLDSRRVVCNSGDKTLQVWDVESGQTLQTLRGHSDWVSDVAVLDSRRVVSGSHDGTLRIWDVESGQTLQTLDGPRWIMAVAVLDSRRVVSISAAETLRVWDVESGQTLQTIEHTGINSVAVMDSHRVVSGSGHGTLHVWDVESGQALQTLEGHSGSVHAVAVLDSRRVISSSGDETLRVWDVESGQTLQTLKGHSDWVNAVAVLDSRRVVSGSKDGTFRVWDVESGQTLQALEEHSGWVSDIAALDSRRVVSGSSDRTLRVWDAERGQTLQILEGHSNWVRTVVLDSRRVVSGSDGTLRVWDVESGRTLQTLEGYSGSVHAVAVLDSRRMVSGLGHGTWRVWDVESGQTLQTLREEYPLEALAVVVLDSRRVVSCSLDDTLRVWDWESGQILRSLKERRRINAVTALDDRRVVFGCRDGTLQLWDVESGQTLQTFEGHSDVVTDVAVLDLRRMVSGSHDRTLRVWDVKNREVECLFTLDAPVTTVAVIPDRHVIVAGDSSGRVHFFDFVEGGESGDAGMVPGSTPG